MKVLYIHFTEIDQDTARHEAGIFVRFARKRFGFVFQVCQTLRCRSASNGIRI